MDHEYFIPTKFHQNPSSGSGEEVENVKVYRRTDGRRTVRYDNSSLEPLAQVNPKRQQNAKLRHFVFSTSPRNIEKTQNLSRNNEVYR